MVVDVVMGYSAIVFGALLVLFNVPLATLMREGDDGWRERGWTEAYEPAFLESDHGRWWIFRGWLLLSATGFLIVGVGLIGRALVF